MTARSSDGILDTFDEALFDGVSVRMSGTAKTNQELFDGIIWRCAIHLKFEEMPLEEVKFS